MKHIEQPEWIDPNEFVSRMQLHWEQNLENVSSPALHATWEQISNYFKLHIMNHEHEDAKKWYVLSPPTGSGKTEGTVIYAAMLADRENYDHPGMLIVTRLISDCEIIAQRINEFGSRDTAIAFHSDTNLKITELGENPVLVITHKAYEIAMDKLEDGDSKKSKWPYFHDWQIGTRKLVVIDECLDIVQDATIGLDGLRETLGLIPQFIRDKHPLDIDAIETMIDILASFHMRTKDYGGRIPDAMLRDDKNPIPGIPPDFRELIITLKEGQLDNPYKHEERLKNLQNIYQSWFYYHKKSVDHTLNSARLLVPDDGIKGAVVMDGTAWANRVYEIHKDSEIIKPPEGSRNYRNFILHVSMGHKVGKNSMKENAKTLIPVLMENLSDKLKGKEVFVVCHKVVEPLMEGFDPQTFDLKTGHWGAIDGSNEWRDCEIVVIVGLPYLPDTWSANTFMALQGAQDTDWLRSDGDRPWEKYPDIRQALMRGRMSSDIVQAINRIRSRKVINSEGDCETTEGYIMLPANNEEADDILKNIRAMMPDILIKEDWNFSAQRKRVRGSNWEKAFLKYLENMAVGDEQSKVDVQKFFGMSPRTMTSLTTKARDSESELYKRRKGLGIRIIKKREGRSYKIFFIKDDVHCAI